MNNGKVCIFSVYIFGNVSMGTFYYFVEGSFLLHRIVGVQSTKQSDESGLEVF